MRERLYWQGHWYREVWSLKKADSEIENKARGWRVEGIMERLRILRQAKRERDPK